MKKVICFTLAILLLMTFGANICFASDEIKVVVDGKVIEFDVPPTTINDRTMVPLRKIFEAMNAMVEWDEASETITARRNNDSIVLRIDSTYAFVNGVNERLDAPATMIEDRTFIPVRFISESFGATVEWDEETKTVTIRSNTNMEEDTSEDTFTPNIPNDIEYISMQNKIINETYLVKDEKVIAEIIKSMTNISKGIYKTEPSYYISFVKGGLQCIGLPMPEAEGFYPKKAIELIKSNMNENNKYYYYLSQAPWKQNFQAIKDNLYKEKGYLAYYPKDDFCYQRPYIELAYKDNADNYKEYSSADFMKEVPLGTLPSDDIFKPVIEYLQSKSLVYSCSNVRLKVLTGKEFTRSITIYLNDELSDSEDKEISTIWAPANTSTGFGVPVELGYVRPTEYLFVVISKERIMQKDIDDLMERYSLSNQSVSN